MINIYRTAILVIISLLYFPAVSSIEINFKSIKSELDKEVASIQGESKDQKNERLFHLYLLSAREMKLTGHEDIAYLFYKEILDGFADKEEEKLEAVLNAVGILYNQKKLKEASDLLEKYKSKNFHNEGILKENKVKKQELDQYFEALDLLINNKAPSQKQKEGNPAISRYFGHMFYEIEMKNLIEKKQYSEALLNINPEGVNFSTIVTKVTYDLLNVLVNKKNVKKLLCEETYNNYPNAFSYTMKICASIIKYRDGKWDSNTRSKDLSDLKNYFSKRSQEMSYLHEALSNLEESK